VDLSRFDPSAVSAERSAALRAELGIPAEALVVGTVGRLVAEKGYLDLFAAARRVRADEPGVRLLVVGGADPEKSDRVPEAVIERERDVVTFAGWREEVPDLLSLMDVFVLASHREGLPRSAIEAAAMGKPLVLTDIRGCREVVRQGVEGMLVPPGDPGRLAGAILALVRDPALREKMGAAARARAVEVFDERAVTDRLVAAYERLLRRKGLAPRASGPSPVRAARRADAAAMARLHREGLPEAFLPALGDSFLRVLYEALATDEDAVALVAENGAGVVGFAAGVVSTPAFYRRFSRRYGPRAALAAAPRLLRPGVLRRLRETARYPRSAAASGAELFSIAVSPAARTGGVGRALAEGIVDGLAGRGATDVRVVVGARNEAGNRFYERLGFRRAEAIEVHDGVPSIVWVIRCPS
jgi:ribosomal protein S18 acetylase RimI-like enzyme